uniref:Natural killer cell granule protein 7 n=1 Tax=Terrapene triunguis TaxID=2587831 RepID=A0A674JVR7_9SAUR
MDSSADAPHSRPAAPCSPSPGLPWCRRGVGTAGRGGFLINPLCPCPPTGYIQATRAFLILAALATAASVLSLLLSVTSCVRIPVSTDLLASIAAFTAGSCTLIAMGVYTGESWHKNQDGQIQLTFEWSFYLGWATLPLWGHCGGQGAVG